MARKREIGIEAEVERIIEFRANKTVEKIYKELVESAPVYSGELRDSIKIRRISLRHWQVAPHTDHDWYAEYGNHANSSDGLIHLKDGRAMPITARGDRSKTAVAFAKAVRPHKGSRFVEKTARKYK